jgi:hypothetical protein
MINMAGTVTEVGASFQSLRACLKQRTCCLLTFVTHLDMSVL